MGRFGTIFERNQMYDKSRWLFIYPNSSHKTAKNRTTKPITMELWTQREATRMTGKMVKILLVFWCHVIFHAVLYHFFLVCGNVPTRRALRIYHHWLLIWKEKPTKGKETILSAIFARSKRPHPLDFSPGFSKKY